ncbi:MAG TPA: DUF429 domain-containing protein [Actinocrinis sp.]|nr:DUF429 domain-containing protein [Actinocrinis sp.]
MNASVMGVDACEQGWIGIGIVWSIGDGDGDGDGDGLGSVRAEFGGTMAELCDNARERTPLSVVAIDMPIGLPDDGTRQADALARRFIRPRGSSVFDTPVREAISLDDGWPAAIWY